jgi:hypothetical protein
MNEEIRIFINQICKDFGICDPLYELEKFASKEHYEVNEFLREIFMAEGLDPDLNLVLFRQLHRKFTDQFGSELYCSSGSDSDIKF